MVRRSKKRSSCFKIITTCGGGGGGGDNVDDLKPMEEEEEEEGKHKRGWSFPNRSTTTNITVISQYPSSHNNNNNNNNNHDDSQTSFEESSAIIIQTAIRGCLARRMMLKLKNIVKLQAAFRGHLERRQAVGTLRCVQAIVKMQSLVRARRARTSQTEDKNTQISPRQFPLGKKHFGSKANINYSSTQELLTNGFARQLLETAPKRKRIHFKCDPSKADSAWKWMERWVSVSSSDSPRAQNSMASRDHCELICSASEVSTATPVDFASDSMDLKQNFRETTLPSDREENLITCDADNFKFQPCHSSSTSTGVVTPKYLVDDVEFGEAKVTCSINDRSQMEMRLDATCPTLPIPVSTKFEVDSEQPRCSMKRVGPEQPETEGKKLSFGSKKTCNPAFASVQSKFEELSSAAISGRSSSSSKVVGVESNLESISSTAESGATKNEHSLTEDLTSYQSKDHVGDSDCGTELSISSTLDSPDRSEIGGVGFEHEAEIMEKIGSKLHKRTDNDPILPSQDVEAIDILIISEPNSFHTISQQVTFENVNEESPEVTVPVDTLLLQQQPERSASDAQIEMESPAVQQVYRSSPEGSPRSHITVPELQVTPSSLVSVKAKLNKSHKTSSNQTIKSVPAGKMSPSNPNHDDGARSNTEHLPKDVKSGKRRNSVGSSRPDRDDQDPRDSSNSLPSYMQATESARAKALADISPRSSPGMHEKDNYFKKRHSLPVANNKQQVSPRIQRSLSQVQQAAKGNVKPTQDRTWQR